MVDISEVFGEILKDWMPKRASFLEGYIFKEMIRTILEEKGYQVVPFGWETFLSYIKKELYGKHKLSATATRIRHAPDLLVFAEDTLYLVEVKARNWDGQLPFEQREQAWLNAYKQYWPESILTLVVPYKHWFYAKTVSEIKLKEHKIANRKQLYLDPADLNPFEEVFELVDSDILYGYKHLASRFFGAFGHNRYYPACFPELKFNKPERYNEHLLNFIRQESKVKPEEMFTAYNRTNLISKKAFDKNMKELQKLGHLK